MTTQEYDTPTFNQTYQFYRYINANPASALAIQFVNTITAAQSQASEEAATAEIDSFFRKTGIYSAVSLASFLEMAEWLFSTLPAWAGFAKHYTYHLKIAGANGAQDAGKVVFNQTGGEDEAYSITYLALDGSKTPLYFQAAQLIDDLTAENPAVRLQTNFAALGLFTGNPDDAETPVPVLCGTVHGQQSLALFAQNDGDGQSNELTAADILGLVYGCLMITIGLIGIIYKAVTHFRDKRRWEEAHNSANRSYEGGEPAQKKSGEGEKAYDKDLQKTSEDDWIVRDMVLGGLYAHTGIKKNDAFAKIPENKAALEHMESLFLQCKELIKQKIEYIGIIVCKDNDDWNTESVKLAKAECLILSQELEKILRTVDPYNIKTVEYLFKDYRNTLK